MRRFFKNLCWIAVVTAAALTVLLAIFGAGHIFSKHFGDVAGTIFTTAVILLGVTGLVTWAESE